MAKSTTKLDVLIVYSETQATSANSPTATVPFKLARNTSYNIVYGYFLETCAKAGLTAALSTSADITGPGTCSSYWTYDQESWHPNHKKCYSAQIFDKFAPNTQKIKLSRKLLFGNEKIKPFNNPKILEIFRNKQLTYDTLPGSSIPTVSITKSHLNSVKAACNSLKKLVSAHLSLNDFSLKHLVMKDQFGAGGSNIYKLKTDDFIGIQKLMQANPHKKFVLQPFAKFDLGFQHAGKIGAADIRLVQLNGLIVQTYIRMAKPGDFRCNEHQGGSLTYLALNEIPQKILTLAASITNQLPTQDSLYSLDFIMTNSKTPYLLEGNTGPGLDWNLSLPKNEQKSKELIQKVVQSLKDRTQN